jgi:hypothetical protein
VATKHRWGSAIGAGVLAELVIIGSIMFAIVIVRKTMGPSGQAMVMAHSVASWIEVIAGPVLVFFAARWVVRPLSAFHMTHALVVVGLAVAGQLSIFSSTVAEGHAPLWIVALAVMLKIAAAVAAAMLARRTGRLAGTVDVAELAVGRERPERSLTP